MEVLVRDILILWVAPCVISTIVGIRKGRGLFGFLLGLLFGWLGMAVICFFRSRKCEKKQQDV